MADCDSQGDGAAPVPASRGKARGRRLAGAALVVIVLGLGLSLFGKPLLVGFARLFRVDDPASSDALVVLTGGEFDRARKAAELYRLGLAPVILIGSDADTKTNINDLIIAGVPAEAIQTIGEVANTHDEAIRIRDYARAHSLRRITVVTTAYHTARARWTFRKALRGLEVEVHMAASRDARFDEATWYRSVAGRRFYLAEVLKTMYYRMTY